MARKHFHEVVTTKCLLTDRSVVLGWSCKFCLRWSASFLPHVSTITFWRRNPSTQWMFKVTVIGNFWLVNSKIFYIRNYWKKDRMYNASNKQLRPKEDIDQSTTNCCFFLFLNEVKSWHIHVIIKLHKGRRHPWIAKST